MKKNNAWAFLLAPIVSLLAVFSAACVPGETGTKVKIELPSVPAVDLTPFRELILTDFREETPVKDFDLNTDLLEYLRDEIEHAFKGRTGTKSVAWDDDRSGTNPEFWKKALPEPRGRLILTGTAQFTQELRKALLANEKRPIDDGPWTPETPWAERRNFTLKLDVYLIRPDSGEVLFRKDFTETWTTANQKTTAEFALFDLLQKIKMKFFRTLFGSEKVQERYLLTR